MEILDTPGPSNGERRRLDEILTNGYEFSIGDSISEGFDLFKLKMGEFVGFTVLYIVVLSIASFIPFGSLLVSAPLAAGFFMMAHHLKTRQDTDFAVFFKGFDKFGPLILLSLVSNVLIVIGTILLIIPGIYLAVAYTIAIPLVLFYNDNFWDNLEWSRKIVTKNWWKFFGFVIVLAFLNLGGLIAFGIGILFTIPITYCALYVVFDRIAQVSGSAANDEMRHDESRPDGDGYRK